MHKTKEIKHDNLTHEQTLEISRIWRAENILQVNEESRRLHCSFCGNTFEKNAIKTNYFGEDFHWKCAEKMKNGETND